MTSRKSTEYIAIHCAATKAGQDFDVSDIRKWHVEQNKWADVGYHLVIKLDGTVQAGRPLDAIGAHVKGYNAVSVGVCLIGGLDANGEPADTFTEAQYNALEATLRFLRRYASNARIQGHRDFPGVAKACPSFDVANWLEARGIAQG